MSSGNWKLIVGIVLAVGIFFLQECRSSEKVEDTVRDYESIMSFEETEKEALIQDANLLAQDVVRLEQNIVSQDMANTYMQAQFEEFSQVQSYMKAELLSTIANMELSFDQPVGPETEFDGLVFSDSLYLHRDTVSKYFLRIPKTFSFSDTWLTLAGTITKNFVLDTLAMINKFDVTLGYEKPDKPFAFLRKAEPVLVFNSYSPYSTIPYVNNLVVEDNRSKMGKIFTSRPACFVYGFLTNTIITKTTSNGTN